MLGLVAPADVLEDSRAPERANLGILSSAEGDGKCLRRRPRAREYFVERNPGGLGVSLRTATTGDQAAVLVTSQWVSSR